MNDPKAQQWLTRADGLATRLRRARETAGLSGLSLSAPFGWKSSKVTRIEQGTQVPSVKDVNDWARECGLTEKETADLLRLLDEFNTVRGVLRHRTKSNSAPAQTDMTALIESSSLVRSYSVAALPGVLQLPEYARAIFEEGSRTLGDGPDIAEAVHTRMRRQALLYDPTRRFEIVLDEGVLYRRRGSREVMSAQMDRLVTLGSLGNVDFGIVPFSKLVTVPAKQGFTIYDDEVVVDALRGDEPAGDLAFYVSALEQLWSTAVRGDEARELVIKAADRLMA